MDREIVIRAREGDHDAFARLAAASIGRLNAIARLILHDATAAEDAVQEALVDAWRDLRSLRDPDLFDAWLTRILVRACQDARRRVRRRGQMELQIDTPVGFAFDDAETAVANADRLERGLRRLTVDQRTVLVLTFYLDLPLADAAAILNIPIGTMKSRLNRSLAALRAAIDAVERQPNRSAELPA
jgi:RNA polymerase sigma-70 factor (ECF subfamily)